MKPFLIALCAVLWIAGCGKYEHQDPTGAKVKVLYERGVTPEPAPAGAPAGSSQGATSPAGTK